MAKTKIITLMFHRVFDLKRNYEPAQFRRYLEYLIQAFPIVLPQDVLPRKPIAICLTFDDAYYDFYQHVFPLLKEFNIKAILAVSVKYILENTTIDSTTRLSVVYPEGMDNDLYQTHVPFCTWEELREMASSGYVQIASHGFKHANLSDPKVDWEQEIIDSKQILENKLEKPIHYYVYPYGKMTRAIHKKVCKYYQFGVRIGSSLNRGWDQQRRHIYRFDAEQIWPQLIPIDNALIKKLTFKYWLNRLRFK